MAAGAVHNSIRLDLADDVRLLPEMRRLLVLALPIMATTVSRMAMQFIDFVMVSRLGTEATAAISPSTIFVFTLICLGMGATTSVQTFSAQAMGRREPRKASAYAWQSIYIAAAFLLLSFPAMSLTEPFWALVGHPPAVQSLEVSYCRIAIWSMGFAIAVGGLEGFFNGVQKPSVALIAAIAALIFNAFGNYCLIFGNFGFPALGIAGSAYATVLGWAVRMAIMMIVFLSSEFRQTYGTGKTWRLDLSKLRGIYVVGGPIAIQWVLDIGAWFVFLSLLMKGFGTAAMAASNIALQYMHFSFMPAIGIGIALSSLVGHAIGEGRPYLAIVQSRACMIVTGLFMGLVGLLFLFARLPLMELMSAGGPGSGSDPTVVRLGAEILVWAAVFQLFDAAAITYMNALRGAGDTRWPVIFVAINCWVVFIGGGYAVSRLMPGLGVHGLWLMCTLYIILYGVFLWGRWHRGAWRKIKLFAEQPPPGIQEAPEGALGPIVPAGSDSV